MNLGIFSRGNGSRNRRLITGNKQRISALLAKPQILFIVPETESIEIHGKPGIRTKPGSDRAQGKENARKYLNDKLHELGGTPELHKQFLQTEVLPKLQKRIKLLESKQDSKTTEYKDLLLLKEVIEERLRQ